MATLHIVPHTHWDREWYLPFQAMRVKLVHLVDGLLELLERDPRFDHFTLDGQTIVLDDYLAIRPERRADLEKHIRSGRLLVGPWTILPDEFLVSPEALIRNLLRGSATAARFGPRMDVGYVPDPFGHVAQLPQILRGFGIDNAVFRRGLGPEPTELWWEAPDGSRVLVAYLRDGYDNAARLPTEPGALADALAARRDSLARHSAVSCFLLLNGTDHHEAQPELGATLDAARADGLEDEARISTLPAYLSDLRAELAGRESELPVVRGELRDPSRHHLLPGVLSSRTWIKQRNHDCESLLERWAEPLSAWAELVGDEGPHGPVFTGHLATPRVADPRGLLAEAWRLVLECQPHDSICGCSVDAVHEEMRSRFDQAEQLAAEIARQGMTSLADAIDTSSLAGRGALAVFNTGHGPRTDVVRARLELGAGLDAFEIVDGDAVVPHREVRRRERRLADLELGPRELRGMLGMVEDGAVMGLALQQVHVARDGARASIELVVAEGAAADREAVDRGMARVEALLEDASVTSYGVLARFATEVEVELVARDVPAHGYRALAVRTSDAQPQPDEVDDGREIANELLEVRSGNDGTLTLTDRRSGERFAGLLRLRDRADRGDSYNFCPLEGDAPVESARPAEIRRVRAPGEERLEIESSLAVPVRLAPARDARADERVELPYRVVVRLRPGIARADVELELDNTAEDHRLELVAPVGFAVERAEYGGHFEIARRATKRPAGAADWAEQPVAEQPMRGWVAGRRANDATAPGLLVSARALREASVSPDGEIALTLVRAFGWLSRDDLSNRRGGAGPPLPVPGGQSPGRHRFDLSLVPVAEGLHRAVSEADAFDAGLRGIGTRIGPGRLPASAALLRASPDGVRLSAVKLAEDGSGTLVVRVVNETDGPAEVRLESLFRIERAARSRMDETPLAALDVEGDGAVAFPLRAAEVGTARLELRRPD